MQLHLVGTVRLIRGIFSSYFLPLSLSAVLFYSTPVLKPIIPDQAGLIGIGIAVLNALMTFPPMFLVDVSTQTGRQERPDLYDEPLLKGYSSCLSADRTDPHTPDFARRHDPLLHPPRTRPQYAQPDSLRRPASFLRGLVRDRPGTNPLLTRERARTPGSGPSDLEHRTFQQLGGQFHRRTRVFAPEGCAWVGQTRGERGGRKGILGVLRVSGGHGGSGGLEAVQEVKRVAGISCSENFLYDR